MPGPRSGRSRAGQQDLVSQHRTQPISIEQDKVAAMAECVTAGQGASAGEQQG